MHKLSVVGVSGQAGAGKDTVANYIVEKYGFVRVALADPLKRLGFRVFRFSEEQLWGPSDARNAVDDRFAGDLAWDRALERLHLISHEYCADVLGTADDTRLEQASNSLIHWFYWLKSTFYGKLSPRIMLQTLGTEWGREVVGEDIWMNYFFRTVRTLLHEDGNTHNLHYTALEGVVKRSCVKLVYTPVRGVIASDVRFENEFKRLRNEGGSVIRVIRPDTDADAATIGVAGHASEQHNYSFENFDFILNNNGTLLELYRAIDTYMTVFDATHH